MNLNVFVTTLLADFYVLVIVASTTQHVWSIATPAKSGFATAAVTLLAGGSETNNISSVKLILRLN